MKKLLKVSLVAMFVAVPTIASAADIPNAGTASIPTNTNVATTSFVAGAYNAAIGEINTNRAQINANTTAIAGKQAQLTNGSSNVDTTVKTTIATENASSTALVTESAVRAAINAAQSATTYTAGSGLALNGNEFSASGITTSNIASDAGILATQLDSGVQTSLGKADTAAATIATYGDVVTHDASEFATASQGATADANAATIATYGDVVTHDASEFATASQGATADANAATIATYGDVVTHAASDFATASQGAKADTALQSGANISLLTNDANYVSQSAMETAISSAIASSVDDYGFNVYGNWATPGTATGSVTVTNANLQSNGQ